LAQGGTVCDVRACARQESDLVGTHVSFSRSSAQRLRPLLTGNVSAFDCRLCRVREVFPAGGAEAVLDTATPSPARSKEAAAPPSFLVTLFGSSCRPTPTTGASGSKLARALPTLPCRSSRPGCRGCRTRKTFFYIVRLPSLTPSPSSSGRVRGRV